MYVGEMMKISLIFILAVLVESQYPPSQYGQSGYPSPYPPQPGPPPPNQYPPGPPRPPNPYPPGPPRPPNPYGPLGPYPPQPQPGCKGKDEVCHYLDSECCSGKCKEGRGWTGTGAWCE